MPMNSELAVEGCLGVMDMEVEVVGVVLSLLIGRVSGKLGNLCIM